MNRAGARARSAHPVASSAGSLISGRSISSSIVRLPSCDQIRSYSRRTSSSVGCGDQSMSPVREVVETDLDGAVALIERRVQHSCAGT